MTTNHTDPKPTTFSVNNNFQGKANFIWKVADDILRGVFKQHEYGDVTYSYLQHIGMIG